MVAMFTSARGQSKTFISLLLIVWFLCHLRVKHCGEGATQRAKRKKEKVIERKRERANLQRSHIGPSSFVCNMTVAWGMFLSGALQKYQAVISPVARLSAHNTHTHTLAVPQALCSDSYINLRRYNATVAIKNAAMKWRFWFISLRALEMDSGAQMHVG